MCGLVGFVGPARPAALAGMTEALRRRGPDEDGAFSERDVHLGFRRLAVIDLDTGSQPLRSVDGDVVLVFNGEIYNHRALRLDLEREGAAFGTDHADSEVVLAGYRTRGPAFLDELEGMFAFVLYDRRRRLLFGARDRFGQKPLYLQVAPRGEVRLAFASSIPALLQHPDLGGERRLSRPALLSLLTHDYVTGRQAIYEGIERLLPGEAFTYRIDDEALTRWRWYRPSRPARPATFDDAARAVRAQLAEGVRLRLEADVPVGVLLSGGVDSSLLAALAVAERPIDSFSIGFEEESFDESEPAAAAAAWAGTRHHRRVFRLADLRARIEPLVKDLDEPFADPSLLPMDLLSSFAREHVTVALGGDGGDELFAGYDPFLALGAGELFARLPPAAQRAAATAAQRLPASDRNVALSFAAQRFVQGAGLPSAARTAAWMSPFSRAALQALAPDLVAGHDDEDLFGRAPPAAREPRGRAGRHRAVDDALRFFQTAYLPDDILVKADRASMRHGLELRAPFLHRPLVELANGLPASWKLRLGRTKRVLKRAALVEDPRPLLPERLVYRRKKGFGVPVAAWLRGPLRDEVHDVLLSPWPGELGFFEPAAVRSLLARHDEGRENLYKELWVLFVLKLWATSRR